MKCTCIFITALTGSEGHKGRIGLKANVGLKVEFIVVVTQTAFAIASSVCFTVQKHAELLLLCIPRSTANVLTGQVVQDAGELGLHPDQRFCAGRQM